ncbi:MAG: sigma-70 family RNA polymerase sigma factor [Betaproteobacteria bacterium]|nr:sigma-70 family RNA polymerase sigma factor [Betaproteobacteria bacterium]
MEQLAGYNLAPGSGFALPFAYRPAALPQASCRFRARRFRLRADSVDSDPFAAELQRHRRYLLRVAQLQLRDHDAAAFDEEVDLEDFDPLFRDDGGWATPPAEWGDPESALSRREFFDVLDFCLDKLPPNTARVFMMREVMELETDEIGKELTITSNNLWVILYRARMALRQCLEQNWFSGQARASPGN